MVLGSFPCRGVLLLWHIVGQGPAVLAAGAVGWLCWGLTSQSTIFQSCRDGAIASWVINQYFRGVKCLAQGHNTAEVGLEPRTSRSGVRHSTTEPPRSPQQVREWWAVCVCVCVFFSSRVSYLSFSYALSRYVHKVLLFSHYTIFFSPG